MPADSSIPENSAAELSNVSTGYMKTGINAEYTQKLFEQFQSTAKLDLLFGKASKTSFQFGDVKRKAYAPAKIGAFINSGRVKYDNPFVNQLKDNDIFIVSELAMSKSILIEMFDKTNQKVEVDIQPIKDAMAGGKLIIKNNTSVDSKIEFESTSEAIVFATQMVQLRYQGSIFKVTKTIHNKLKEKGIPESIVDMIIPSDKQEFDSEKEFNEYLKKCGINQEDIDKFRPIFSEYASIDKFETKPVEGFQLRNLPKPDLFLQQLEVVFHATHIHFPYN
ncbi:MAG: hypothetical protein HC831_10180 [Chloroflexia bacterium]|nr:hypothetical protein [Chloroflexia bacterium]